MSVLGIPKKPLTPSQRKAWALCPVEVRSELLRKWRQAEWARRARAANPELFAQRAVENKRRLAAKGYYRKGNKGCPPTSARRREYYRWYNREVRPLRGSV